MTPGRTRQALAQFVRSLVSYRSKYDEGMASSLSVEADFPNFIRAENRGKKIFLRRLRDVCHLPPNQAAVFSDPVPQNNGLDAGGKSADLGVADVTFNASRRGNSSRRRSATSSRPGRTCTTAASRRCRTWSSTTATASSAHPNLDPRLGGPGGRTPA